MTTGTFAALLGVALAAGLAAAGTDEGKVVYDQKCKVCHRIASDAGKMADKGGPLDGVGTKRDTAWLKLYLTDPKAVLPDAKMPKIKLEEKQLDDLIAYLATLK